MLKLSKVTIFKYKGIESEQSFDVDENISVLVGMNEAGKTSILEAIAKANYFDENDELSEFNSTHDYPRKERKKGYSESQKAIVCTYVITKELRNIIEKEVGKDVLLVDEVERYKNYANKVFWAGISSSCDIDKFVKNKCSEFNIKEEDTISRLLKARSKEDITRIKDSFEDEDQQIKIEKFEKYYAEKDTVWSNPIEQYILNKIIHKYIPKFMYYDEYYALPSDVSIENLQKKSLESNDLKTAKALFELAEIDIDELIGSSDYEDYKAELESTQALITDELFKYWKTNTNLNIEFDIEPIIESTNNPNTGRIDKIVEHILKIRVKNQRSSMTLPLQNRSKGFNWFFSFLVWFKRIQEDKSKNYILLLDEPGLNLHATAQADLLNFFEDLSNDGYQIIYTTHSPFMIDSTHLERVRTIVEDPKTGTKISESIQEKDPRTLFPLQAALGYDIAQNLFISKNNLLVEGVSDLMYLTYFSNLLKANGKEGLSDDVTIVPVGGLDKIVTFIALLGASKLDIVCLLDTTNDPKGKQKLDDMILHKIIKEKSIKFFHEFTQGKRADIEDIFEKSEYLNLFNESFSGQHPTITEKDLKNNIEGILYQIKDIIGNRFNHYKPANTLLKTPQDISQFSSTTIDRFELLFKEVNKLF